MQCPLAVVLAEEAGVPSRAYSATGDDRLSVRRDSNVTSGMVELY